MLPNKISQEYKDRPPKQVGPLHYLRSRVRNPNNIRVSPSVAAYKKARDDNERLLNYVSPLTTAALKTTVPLYFLSQIKDIDITSQTIRNWYLSQPFNNIYKNYPFPTEAEARNATIKVGDVIHQLFVNLESFASPISWLQPSSSLSPFLIPTSNKSLVISPQQIKKDIKYWKEVIDKANYPGFFDSIKTELLESGIIVENGVPKINNALRTVVAPRAKFVQKILELNTRRQVSQTWLAYRVKNKAGYHPGSYRESFNILLGKSTADIYYKWFKAQVRAYSLRYFRLLDDPLEFLSSFIGFETGVERTALYKSFKNKFGVGGAKYYGESLYKLWLRHIGLVGKNIILPLIAAKYTHEKLKDIHIESGIFTPIAYTGATLDIGRSIYGKPFKAIADVGDKFVPGMSSLGVAFGNIMMAGINTYIGARLFQSIRTSETYEAFYNIANTFTPLNKKGLEWLRPLSKIQQKAYLREKVKYEIPELLKKFMPSKLGEFIEKRIGSVSHMGKAARTAMIIAGILSIPNVIFGTARLLGGEKDTSTLIQEYTGHKNVPVYQSHDWLFGQQYRGGEFAAYMGPNWFQRMIHDYRGKTLWRNNESAEFRTLKSIPIIQDIIKPYYLEETNFKHQPYPITGPTTSFLGPIGPLYGATLGQLFKPTKYMFPEQWALTQKDALKKYEQEKIPTAIYQQTVAPIQPHQQSVMQEVYGTPLNEPFIFDVTKPARGKGIEPLISPYSAPILTAQAISAWQETIGLPGYISRLLVTNPEEWYSQYNVLPSASEINSLSEQYYYMNLGDYGQTEAWRRIVILQNAARKEYNMIQNDQPEWMPDEGFYIKFRHGDPYRQIYRGYERIPGPGLTERKEFANLKGVEYKNYPLSARLLILGDIAMTSDHFKQTYMVVDKLVKEGKATKDEEAALKRVRSEFIQKISSRKFLPYSNKEDLLQWSSLNPIKGVFRLAQTLEELIVHASSPLSELLPVAPKEKFSIHETPIEAYKHKVIQGNESAIWGHPWRDFIRPFVGRIAGLFTDKVMPWVKKHRRNEMYLDYLKYVKYSKAAEMSMYSGDIQNAYKFKQIASTTAVAVNPYKSLMEVYPTLPKEERPYFIHFAKETDKERRKKILEMTSPIMKRIYKARWELLDYAKAKEEYEKGKLSEEEFKKFKEKVKQHIAHAEEREEELFSPEILSEVKQLPETYGNEYTVPLTQWEGYSPRVSMTELKVGFLESIGEDPIDYRIPKKEILRLNHKEPEEYFSNISMFDKIDMGIYNMGFSNLKHRLKNIIYNRNGSDNLQQHVYTIEYRPKIKYAFERHN